MQHSVDAVVHRRDWNRRANINRTRLRDAGADSERRLCRRRALNHASCPVLPTVESDANGEFLNRRRVASNLASINNEGARTSGSVVGIEPYPVLGSGFANRRYLGADSDDADAIWDI